MAQCLQQEEWRIVEGHVGYMVSNLGKVKSIDRFIRCGPPPGVRAKAGQILTPWVNCSTGYLQVVLTNRKKESVHRLVAIAFLGPPPSASHQVNHLDSNRQNASLSNLEWSTPTENAIHSFKAGRKPTMKGCFGAKHPASKAVVGVCLSTGKEFHYASAMDAVREGFDSGGISSCCAGLYKSHRGRIWRRA